MALCPSCRPSTMPAAMASTFLRAPQISTPTTSVVVFTRMAELANRLCMSWASCISCSQHAEFRVGVTGVWKGDGRRLYAQVAGLAKGPYQLHDRRCMCQVEVCCRA